MQRMQGNFLRSLSLYFNLDKCDPSSKLLIALPLLPLQLLTSLPPFCAVFPAMPHVLFSLFFPLLQPRTENKKIYTLKIIQDSHLTAQNHPPLT